jgi:hypothetical protein
MSSTDVTSRPLIAIIGRHVGREHNDLEFRNMDSFRMADLYVSHCQEKKRLS